MTAFDKVLIANRGEIAARIIRACADDRLSSVAVYADPDADALHVRMADEAWALRGRTGPETYLNIDKLLDVARRSGADAVHPGYGFLSENADFAEAVRAAGLVWIGPDPETIRSLGDKVAARRIAVNAGAPLVAGTDRPVENADEVARFADENGLPIVIKAAFGGGGRGLRVVRRSDEIEEAYSSAVRESRAAFGRGDCFVERFLDKPRHVEAQVIADSHGLVVVAGTRDCSLQRRSQKLVEESPAPYLTAEQRARIHSSAKAICRAARYRGAGTVEYLVEGDQISFLEVNTRLQVEHPVTETTSGIDLVREQFRIAAGKRLSVGTDPHQAGHAFEFRINAEDPGRGFLPTPGTVREFAAPTGPGVRVDSGVASGSSVPGEFDSLLAKLIVAGDDREHALRRAKAALAEMRVSGVPTVLPFHRALLQQADFVSDYAVHTRWIDSDFAERLAASDDAARPTEDAARATITVDIDGKAHAIGLPARLVEALGRTPGGAASGGGPSGGAPAGSASGSGAPDDRAVDAVLQAPVAGSLVKWLVTDGDAIEAGAGVAIVEAMKMESTVAAQRAGTVALADISPGDAVAAEDRIATID